MTTKNITPESSSLLNNLESLSFLVFYLCKKKKIAAFSVIWYFKSLTNLTSSANILIKWNGPNY